MNSLILNKNNIDKQNFNNQITEFCNENGIKSDKIFDIQLVCEEFLFNILFPNYSENVDFSIVHNENQITLQFIYEGENYLNRIDNVTFLSLKLLKNKTQKIQSSTENNITRVEFFL